jgi:hypothetical protein
MPKRFKVRATVEFEYNNDIGYETAEAYRIALINANPLLTPGIKCAYQGSLFVDEIKPTEFVIAYKDDLTRGCTVEAYNQEEAEKKFRALTPFDRIVNVTRVKRY